jgi:hypothetical protein
MTAPLAEDWSTRKSSRVRVSSKGKAQARCFKEQKAERKAVISSCFNKEST